MIRSNKAHFMECSIAGVQYHDALEVWDKLKVGTKLFLRREYENDYDPQAILVYFLDTTREYAFLLGYVPKAENSQLAMFFDLQYDWMFEARLSKIDPDEHYEQRLKMIVTVRRNPVAVRDCPIDGEDVYHELIEDDPRRRMYQ